MPPLLMEAKTAQSVAYFGAIAQLGTKQILATGIAACAQLVDNPDEALFAKLQVIAEAQRAVDEARSFVHGGITQ